MHRALRAIALAAVAALVFTACGGGGGQGAQQSPAGDPLGSEKRPIRLAITPSAEVQRLTTTGNAIAAALGQATNLR